MTTSRTLVWCVSVWAILASTGCAQLLGIDQDYGDLPAAGDDGGHSNPREGGPAGLEGGLADGPSPATDGSASGGSDGAPASDAASATDVGGSTDGEIDLDAEASGDGAASTDGTARIDGGASTDGSTPTGVSPILRVLSGSTVVPAGASSQGVTLPSVDPARSFVVSGALFGSSAPSDGAITGQITGSTELTFARTGSTGTPDVPVRYYVAEFASGVTVQRGSTAMTSTSVNVQLPISASQAKSFPLVNYRNTGAAYGSGDFVRAKQTGSNVLSLNIGAAAPGGIVEWQVVTFDGASVQTGDVTMSGSQTQATVTLSQAVSPSASWLLFSNEVNNPTGTTAELLATGRISSPTQLAFARAGGGASNRITWYVVAFDNGTTVQSSTVTLADSNATTTATLSPTDASTSVAVTGGAWLRTGTTAYAGSASPGYGTYTLELTSGTSLALTRGASGTATQSAADYSVVTFY